MQHFDVIIIGGGINGAGIVRDCALRGLKTLIVDKNDFASGTSSRSTKLIHGGIRYLEHYEFKLVWEACHERKILTQIAPQLVRTIPFIIPSYKNDKRPLWLIRLGMLLYDLMAGFKNIHWHRNLSAKKILQFIPGLKAKGLRGGGVYYDCQTNDARLTLANIQDAVRHGAIAKNYTEVATIKLADTVPSTRASLRRSHEIALEVVCQDILTAGKSTYTTSFIVNATGPWLDQNLQKWHLSNTKNLRLTKGIHFFIPRHEAQRSALVNKAPRLGGATRSEPEGSGGTRRPEEYALLCMSQKDERVFFVIPHGEYSLVGTTDTDFKKSPDEVKVEAADIDYLLNELNRLFPEKKLTRHDIFGEYAGLRPLLNTEGGEGTARARTSGSRGPREESVKKEVGAVSREYQLKEERKGDGTILHVVGGKLTTYRKLAEKVTDRIMKKLRGENQNELHKPINSKFFVCAHKSQTATKKLPGSEFPQKTLQEFRAQLLRDNLDLIHLPQDIAENLIQTYGSEIYNFLPYLQEEATPDPTQRIIPESPVIWAQLSYGIDYEFIRTADDFIQRRTELYLYLKKHPTLADRISAELMKRNPGGV